MKKFIDGNRKAIRPGLYYRRSDSYHDKEPTLCLFENLDSDEDVQSYKHSFGTGIWQASSSECKNFFRVSPQELEKLKYKLKSFERSRSWLEKGIAIHETPKSRASNKDVYRRYENKKLNKQLKCKKTKIYYLLNPSRLPIEARSGESISSMPGLQGTLDTLIGKEIVLSYSTIKGTLLGFPLEQPANTLVYRIDYVINDLNRVIEEYKQKKTIKTKRRGLEHIKIHNPHELKTAERLRKDFYYNKARKFFGTEDISRWTAEMNALDDVDPNFKDKDKRGCKNKLSKEAFLSLIYGAGYIMARVIVFDEKLPQFEKELGDGYIKRTINI